MDYEKKALSYHEKEPRGKISIKFTKPLDSQSDLALAYSPGVAGPCREIAKEKDLSFNYTTRGNLVAVISNGTAVLGLGNIGPYAAKPVMEGKGMLFKKFANIDVFDIEVNCEDPDKFIEIVKSLEPTFGGVNLEDIKAPECFYIEERLRKEMSIPVFHDDQHGTAIITAAGFINACELTDRQIETTKVVFSGAGAAAISCAKLLLRLGVKLENIVMCDSKGVLHVDRDDLNEYKKKFAVSGEIRTLSDAIDQADCFIGVSQAGILTEAMLLKMKARPIVFALANPDPEISPDLAKKVRPDVIVATGRSDYPNQVNNVLGFPYIFRGALDVRATVINEAMEMAAVYAIASLAKETVPEEVMSVYKGVSSCRFGPDYLIPKPVDQRVLLRVAPAVAKAAMDTGVAKIKLDLDQYREKLERILGPSRRIVRNLQKEITNYHNRTGFVPRVLLTAGDDPKIIKAVNQVAEEGDIDIAILGNSIKIKKVMAGLGIKKHSRLEIINPNIDIRLESFAETLYELRGRQGVSRTAARHMILDQNYFAAIMLYSGQVDAMLNGTNCSYRNAVKPILEVIKPSGGRSLAGVYMMANEDRLIFFADCTINVEPSSEELAKIALSTAELAATYTKDPIRVAMLSFSSFGSSPDAKAKKVAKAVQIVRELNPSLEIDGEMQVDVALNAELRQQEYPFCTLKDNANVLIFPDLASANIAYKILTQLSDAKPTGPILVGIKKPAHSLQRGASVQEIINMIYLSAHQVVKAKMDQEKDS